MGLHNFREFFQPPKCLDEAKKVLYYFYKIFRNNEIDKRKETLFVKFLINIFNINLININAWLLG